MRLLFFLFIFLFCCTLTAISQDVDTVILNNNDTIPLVIAGGIVSLIRQQDDKIGKQAMPFDVVDYNDLPHKSADYLGKTLIVYFWDVWSWDSCEGQTMALNYIVEKYPKEVAIVSFVREVIGLDERAFLQTKEVKFPIVSNSKEFGVKYHGYKSGIPILFFIDEKGYWQKVGLEANAIEGIIQEMLSR